MSAIQAKTQEGVQTDPQPIPNAPNPTKILLIEDDHEALEELYDVIQIEGWTPIAAHNVEAGMKLLETDHDIRVVVTDVHFANERGNANGIQFVSRAKAKFADRSLTYVVLSGDPDKLDCSRQEGVFKFLPKPLMPARLVSTIEGALECNDGVPLRQKLAAAQQKRAR